MIQMPGLVWAINPPEGLDIQDGVVRLNEVMRGGRLENPDLVEAVVSYDFPNGMTAEVRRNGLVDFDFASSTSRGLAVRMRNLHILCLHASLLQVGKVHGAPVQRISPADMLHIAPSGQAFNTTSSAFASLHLLPEEVARIWTIEESWLNDAAARLSALLDHTDDSALTFADLLHGAAAAFSAENDPECLVSSWTLVEALLTRLWLEYIDRPTVTGQRRKDLLGYSASAMAEALELAGVLASDRYTALERAQLGPPAVGSLRL